jgi:hypothetical protein
VHEIADRYRTDGYEVLLGEDEDARRIVGSIAPDLRNSQFDFVLQRGTETVFLQLKRTGQQSSGELARLEELARKISATPNVRFDVLWLPPMVPESKLALILQTLAEARLIVPIYPAPALVLAENMIQATLRRLAELSGPLERHSTIGIAETLHAEGILSPRHWAGISRGTRVRNAIIHGVETSPSDESVATIAEELIGIAEELADTATFERATQLVRWFFERFQREAGADAPRPPSGETAVEPSAILAGAFPAVSAAVLEEAVRIIADFGQRWAPAEPPSADVHD